MTKKNLPIVHRETSGRPAYSDAVRRRVLAGLRSGMTRQAASGHAGIHRATVGRWIDEDEEFRRQVEIAEDVAEARFTAVLTLDAIRHGSALSATRWLERRRRVAWRESVNIIETEATDEDRASELGESELDRRIDELVRRAVDASRSSGAPSDAPGAGETSGSS